MKTVFFRDDDLGWEHSKFRRLLELFMEVGCKLNAEAIPLAAGAVCRPGDFAAARLHLEVHAHGYRHANHRLAGKKAEFGPGRHLDVVQRELAEAGGRTAELFGDLYFPAFTPPWNRIDDAFIPLLTTVGFKVLSRDGPVRASKTLVELNVGLDLHTDRKHPGRGVDDWLQAVDRSEGSCLGIMLHHGCMEETDFGRLRDFLQELAGRGVRTLFFSELYAAVPKANGRKGGSGVEPAGSP